MKKILILLPLFAVSFFVSSNHHKSESHEMKKHENNFAYLSTYTIPAGSNPATLSKSLLKNVEDLKKDGYNNCGLLRHAFGGDRAFYSYCYFDTWEQFAQINDNAESADVRQLYGDHDDRLVSVDEKNLITYHFMLIVLQYFNS